MTLGRNDRCWCGSGRKYKRCHLEHDRQRDRQAATQAVMEGGIALDAVAVRFGEVASRMANFSERVTEPVNRLNESFRRRIGDRLVGREAAEALESYLTEIEDEFARLAATHSRMWWLYTTRRLEPTRIGEASDWTVVLYRRILTLGVLKHGAPTELAAEPFIQIPTLPGGGKTLLPASLTDDDVVAVRSLEYLAYEYNHAATAFRRVGKGAVLKAADGDFDTPASEEVEQLMSLVDHRAERYPEFGGSSGTAIEVALPPDGVETRADVALGVMLNVSRADAEPLQRQFNVVFPGPPNYLPAVRPLEPVRNILHGFESEVKSAYGVSTDALLATIWGLSIHLARGLQERGVIVASQVFRTGYLPVTDEFFEPFVRVIAQLVAAWHQEFARGTLDPADAMSLTEEATAALRYSETDYWSISLWDRLPYRVLIAGDGLVMIDYSATGEVLLDVLRQIGFLDGSPANIKAANFEDEILRRATEEGFDTWETQRELFAYDGTHREIDASFVVGHTLLIVECKAFAQNPRIDRGDFAALKARRETLEGYLDQARTLALFLTEKPSGRNYQVPREIETIDYLLCTPGIEYIWKSSGQDLWFSDTHPRIVPPAELLEILDELI